VADWDTDEDLAQPAPSPPGGDDFILPTPDLTPNGGFQVSQQPDMVDWNEDQGGDLNGEDATQANPGLAELFDMPIHPVPLTPQHAVQNQDLPDLPGAFTDQDMVNAMLAGQMAFGQALAPHTPPVHPYRPGPPNGY